MPEREKLIEIKDLQITFGSGRKKFVAVDHVNIDIYKGETFSLVGESGSGKTTIGRAITRINPVSAGEILFKGLRIDEVGEKVTDKLRGYCSKKELRECTPTIIRGSLIGVVIGASRCMIVVSFCTGVTVDCAYTSIPATCRKQRSRVMMSN